MVNIFLAPRSGEQSTGNFQKTIKEGYKKEDIESYLSDEDRTQLANHNVLYIWGNMPSKKSSWDKMNVGDYVFFYKKGKIVWIGKLLHKSHNKKLAENLWGPKLVKNNVMGYWEYIFCLEDMKEVNIDYSILKKYAGYSPNAVVQGFQPFKDEGTRKILEKYDTIENFIKSESDKKNNGSIEKIEKPEITVDPNLKISYEIKHVHDYISSKGFNYSLKDIANFYLSLKTKPFVILAGISGTGKTQLARKFAEAINAECELIPVKPDWTDNSDLIGYVDIDNSFKEKAIIKTIKKAASDSQKIYIVLLDEMNLARVEHYFSDFLSIIETREYEGNRIVTKNLITDVNYKGEDKLKELIIPENVYIVGTVNMDETTHPFSRKVLDRANSIELNKVNLDWANKSSGNIEKLEGINNDFLKAKYIHYKDLSENEKEYSKKIINILKKIDEILKEADFQIGYRIRDELCFYMLYQREIKDIISYEEAFDFQIMQKILPRIQGSSSRVKKTIVKLIGYLSGKGDFDENYSVEEIEKLVKEVTKNRRSINKLLFMLRRYEDDGFTSFWI